MHLVAVDVLSVVECPPTVIFNGISLFNKDAGLKVLLNCEHRGIIVLGIEGFSLGNSTRTPIMECIADFSSLVSEEGDLCKLTVRHAREFIVNNGDSCQMMEFVLAKNI